MVRNSNSNSFVVLFCFSNTPYDTTHYNPHFYFLRGFTGFLTSPSTKSPNSCHVITSFKSIFVLRLLPSKRNKAMQFKSFTFSSLLFYMEGKTNLFLVESSDNDIRKLILKAAPEV